MSQSGLLDSPSVSLRQRLAGMAVSLYAVVGGCSGNNPSAIRDNAIDCVIDACGIPQAIQVQVQAAQLRTSARLVIWGLVLPEAVGEDVGCGESGDGGSGGEANNSGWEEVF